MRRDLPEINAGSMADIAFLLLIFFLVTTTLNQDQGIFTKLPRKTDEQTKLVFNEKNILDVIINTNNELYVEDKVIDISSLTQIAMNFIDNGGGTDQDGNPCLWCHGAQDPTSSDHLSKALIAIDANRSADYGTYIQVLDNVHRAYGKLRDRYAMDTYQMSYKEMITEEQKGATNQEQLRERIQNLRTKYPLLVTDSKIQE
jgi:biopolymer transport protein ExbD